MKQCVYYFPMPDKLQYCSIDPNISFITTISLIRVIVITLICTKV